MNSDNGAMKARRMVVAVAAGNITSRSASTSFHLREGVETTPESIYAMGITNGQRFLLLGC